MLGDLRSFLAPTDAPLPGSTVSLISVIERPVGLGGLRGIEPYSTFPAVALKGGRFDTVIRFQMWGNDPVAVENAANALYGRLHVARETLRGRGFLKIVAEGAQQAEHVAALGFWRNAADYRVLYEYHFQESEAESLIAQIPVTIDDLLLHDSLLITDDMVRWDSVAAPTLTVRLGNRRPLPLRELVILSFLPAGWDGQGVTIAATVNGTTVTQAFPSRARFWSRSRPRVARFSSAHMLTKADGESFPMRVFRIQLCCKEVTTLYALSMPPTHLIAMPSSICARCASPV